MAEIMNFAAENLLMVVGALTFVGLFFTNIIKLAKGKGFITYLPAFLMTLGSVALFVLQTFNLFDVVGLVGLDILVVLSVIFLSVLAQVILTFIMNILFQ
jgi:hypothetical protein